MSTRPNEAGDSRASIDRNAVGGRCDGERTRFRRSLVAKARRDGLGFLQPADVAPPWRRFPSKPGGSMETVEPICG